MLGRLIRLLSVERAPTAAALLLAWVLNSGCEPSPRAAAPTPASPWIGKPAPLLTGALTWLNGAEIALEQLRGKVALIHFFDYNCVNCIRTYPYLQEWQRRYASLGLQLIGVHSPQYQFATDPGNVMRHVRRYGLTHPIAVDSHWTIARAYGNHYWPRLFLVDADGRIQFDQTGEGAYAEIEQTIQRLLRDSGVTATLPAILPPIHDFDRPGAVCYPVTPELYLGRLRGALGNPSPSGRFELPAYREEGKIYASGAWGVFDEYMRHAEDTDALDECLWIKYRAVEVNVVMKPESVYWMPIYVFQDDAPIPPAVAGPDIQYDETGASFVRVDEPRMYTLIRRQPYALYELRLCARGRGLSVYSFSFGTCVIPTDQQQLRQPKPIP